MTERQVNVLATSRAWNEPLAARLAARTGTRFELITSPAGLTLETLRRWAPRRVFFPHWSSIVPREIFEEFECVMFHMTDLPFGRGGSPLQNLIARGIYQTKVCALRCAAGIDAGPVYLRRDLSLDGAARDIFERVAVIVEEMIAEIVAHDPQPVTQLGEPTIFKRRQPQDGDLAPLADLRQVYDFIRMLDADGYPPAFLEIGRLRLEFSAADMAGDVVQARVSIRSKRQDEK